MSSSLAPSKHKWLKNLFHRGSGANPTSSIHDPEPAVSNEHLNASQPSTQAKLLETLQISGRFSQSVLPKLAGCIDENPAKMAFNILNAIMDVRKQINDNKDELQRVLEETLMLLSTVFAKMEVSSNPQNLVNQTIEQYKREISGELDRIKTLNDRLHSTVFHQLDYENYKDQLKDISQKIGGATSRFNTGMAGTTGIMVDELRDEKRDEKLRRDLQPSEMADHRFLHGGKGALKREICSKGTRVNILNEISKWANDSSEGSPPVFWLAGQAGSGKTTIAYTIMKKFTEARPTPLGANFLCSRQFPETRNLQRIVPTIVFQLARNCTAFRDALQVVDTTGAVHSHTVDQQIEKFLFQPWKERKSQHGLPVYLVVIDALDEIEDTKGSSFLEELLKSIRANNITGLKFLVTSRLDRDIVDLCKTFPPGAVCQLQNVPIEDAKRDIKAYFDIELETFSGTPEMDKLNEQAAGLFIYAATVVKILTGRKLARSEQLKRLDSLLSSNSSRFGSIDQLYQQIMRDAFSNLDDDPELLSVRLSILYTFLCSVERISSSVAASLLNTDIEVAQIVLDNLRAVLYVRDDRVYWYHSSFPDFIFNDTRSNFRVDDKHFAFSCDPATQHGILSLACFRIMQSTEIGLRFNMGDIKSSYLLDSEHAEELRWNIDKNITPMLRYSCIHWVHHLSFSPRENHEHICEVLSDFLRIRVLFWIEVMNLLGKSGDCSYLLQNARRCVSKMNNSAALAKDLQEVTIFAMHFIGCPAADSTPHLYISSLATWQSTSSLSKSWKDAFFGIPTYKNTKGIIDLPLMTKRIGFIESVTFSIDGTQVVAATTAAILVLDTTTGRQQRVLNVENCSYVKFSRNGTRLVARSRNMVHIWDTSTYQLLKKLDADYATISIEGTQILAISIEHPTGAYCQVQVLDISTGTILSTLKMPFEDYLQSFMSFSSVTKRFLIGFDNSVQIWDISTGCPMRALTLEGHTSAISSTVFSPDAKHVVTSSADNNARVWDASTGKSLMVLQHKRPVLALDFSSDGIHIVSSLLGGTLHVWDTTTGAELKVFETNADIVGAVAFSPDGTRIVSGSESAMHVWSWDKAAQIDDTQDIKSSSALREIIVNIAMTDDSKKIMAATHHKMQIWDAATGTELKVISNSAMLSANISRNGEYIVSCQQDESVVVWDATTGDKIIHLNSAVRAKADQSYLPFVPIAVGLSRSGKRFAVSRVEPRTVEIWNIQTGREIEINIDNSLSFLSFSNDEQYIVCGSVHGLSSPVCITIYSVLTGNIIQEIYSEVSSDMFREALFSSNGKDVIVCSVYLSTKPKDTLFEIWDIPSGQLLNTVKGSSHRHGGYGEIDWVNLSNDGKKLVAGCSDGFIRILDVLGGGEITVIGYSGRITTVTFSSDDKRIVSGSRDGSVCVWDLDKDTEESWTLQESNWITSSREQGHRLMWVSELLQVVQPRNTLIISHREHGSVDFKGAMIGEDWGKCYTPRNM